MARINIYFIHAEWLKDRQRIITEFNKLTGKYMFKNFKGTKCRVISEYDPKDINSEILSKINYSPIPDTEMPFGVEENKEKSLAFYNMFLKNLHVYQLSNSLKHYKALEEIVNNSSDDDVNIVVEDDVLYEDKVCKTIEKLLSDVPANYDIVFLGLPSNLDMKAREAKKFQDTKEVFRVLPYNDSYLISKAAAKKLYDNFLPIKFLTNIHLSYLIEKLGLDSKLCIPNIFMDGSKFGMCLSVLNPNNQLLFNNDYMKAKMLLSKEHNELLPEEKGELLKLFDDSNSINAHPDFMYLKATFFSREKKYKEAEKLFDSGVKIYQNNSCMLNHESQFLKDFIALHKYLQTDI